MDLTGTKIVVIGGAGFIGSHTVDALLRENVGEILVFDNFSRGSRDNLASALEDPRVSVHDSAADICQTDILEAALRGADGVFHFAALWLFHCQEFPRAAFRVNVEGMFNVLETCARVGVKKLVFASSASIYGESEVERIDETHPFLNRSFYGATKIADEAMARAFHHRYGLDYVGLRYMNVYGPRQHEADPTSGVVARMLHALDHGRNPVVNGDGSHRLDFVHVTDCARVNVMAMQAQVTDSFYNVGTGYGIAIVDLARLLLAEHPLGGERSIEFVPERALTVRHRIADIERARADLGFTATVSLHAGIAGLIEARAAIANRSVN